MSKLIAKLIFGLMKLIFSNKADLALENLIQAGKANIRLYWEVFPDMSVYGLLLRLYL